MNHHPRGVFLWKPSTCQVLFLKMCAASNSCSTSPGGPPVGWKIFKTCGCSSGSSVSLRMMFTYSSHGYRGSIPRYAGLISRCRKHGPKMTLKKRHPAMSKCVGNHFEALERNNTCNSTSKLRSSLFCDMQCKCLKRFTSDQYPGSVSRNQGERI